MGAPGKRGVASACEFLRRVGGFVGNVYDRACQLDRAGEVAIPLGGLRRPGRAVVGNGDGPAGLTDVRVRERDLFDFVPAGIAAGKAAGMQVIAVPYPGMDRSRLKQADALIESLDRLSLGDLGFMD